MQPSTYSIEWMTWWIITSAKSNSSWWYLPLRSLEALLRSSSSMRRFEPSGSVSLSVL